jgi:multicomponent Na+:H+ antiporter subunit C
MGFLLAIVVGCLYAAGVYLVLRRSIIKLILGIALLSNAANLLIFTSGGLVRGRPPVVPEGQTAVAAPYADPLPQALILTAIVISFGVLAFFMVLVYRANQALETDDVNTMRLTDRLDDEAGPQEAGADADGRPAVEAAGAASRSEGSGNAWTR